MQLKSRHKTIVLAPSKNLESYVAICICLLKERTIAVYEFDESDAPEAIKDFHKIANKPAISDCETVVNGGVNGISWYIDNRYPHPPLYPGDPKAIGHRVSFCNILNDRIEKLIAIFKDTKDKGPIIEGVSEILSAHEELFSFDSMKMAEYNFTDAYFCGLLYFLEEHGIELSNFSRVKEAYKYVLRITSSSMYGDMVAALNDAREREPFYESSDYDRNLYTIPA